MMRRRLVACPRTVFMVGILILPNKCEESVAAVFEVFEFLYGDAAPNCDASIPDRENATIGNLNAPSTRMLHLLYR